MALDDKSIPGVKRTSVLVGETRRSAQVVQCAFCDDGQLVIFTTAKPLPPSAVRRFGRERGWDIDRRGKHKCPNCKENEKVHNNLEKTASPSQQPPRDMDAHARRRVFRAVDEAYDDVNNRYCPSYSDERIAKDLGVPRKWVETIRNENFGPAGVDPELAAITDEIERIDAEVKKAMNTCFEVMAGAEKRITELRASTAVLTGKRM